MADFSIPAGTAASYKGTMSATVFELASPDEAMPTDYIRTTQNWGIEVKWKVDGAFVPFLKDTFHVWAFIESMGPGQELKLPLPPEPVEYSVDTLSVPLLPGNVREYKQNINMLAGQIHAGVYKLAVVVQLHDDAPGAKPYPIIATLELPLLTFFDPS